MMSWENYLNNFGISDIIALAALFGALYTYIVHERRLKRQQSKINSYTIKENEEKERAKKSANIHCSVMPHSKMTKILKIYNDGQSSANNIHISIDEKTLDEIYLIGKLEYPLLNQYGKYDLYFQRYNTPDRSYITIKWTDELGEHSKDFVLTL